MAASPTSSSDLHGSLSFHHFQVLPATDGKPWILGKGAAGITYKATDTILRRSVALKVVDNAVLINEAARERLIEEARVLAALKHPNSAAVYYFGEEGNVCFYAMELVEGQSLEDYIRSHGSLSPRHALDVAAHVAAALGAAHDLGVVHRDVKPANIMLSSDGDGGLSAKLIDFGLAAPQRGASSGDASDEFAGTPLYASPEQLDGVPPDSRSDVYSLGATLFFMLGGRPPFDGKSIAELAKQHTMQEVPLHLLSGLPVEVSALVLRFMAKDPAARPIDGAEARAEIEEMLRRYRHSADRTASEWMRDRFAQVDQAGMLEGGILYKVAQTRGAEELAVFHFDNSARGLVAADRMRTAVPMVRAIKSSSPRRVLDMADTSDGLVVVCEWMSGTRLLSVLRVRRSLPSEEARLVLLPVAQALDEAAAAGMALPHVGLRDVFLQPLANAGTRLTQWQDLRVAVDLLPLAEASEVDINATVVGRSLGVTGSFSYAASEQDAASIVASLAYEVLGGTTAPRAGFYVPLPELSENANRSLRRVFEKGGVGLTASGLVDDLTRFQLPPSGNPNATTVGAPSLAPSRGAYRQMAPDSVSDSGIARRHRRLLAGSLIVLAMLLTAVLLLANRSLNSNVRARDSGSVVSQTTAPSDAEVISSETARVETGPAMDHKDRGTLVELDSMPQSQADQGEVSSGGFGATGGTDRQVVVVPDLDGMPPADDQREQGRKQGWRIRTLGGRDYVPVAQVADFYHMQLVGSGDDAVSLSSRTRIMEFVAGSREAHIDGVKHWLSFPVIIANGNPYLSRMDLAKTVDPAMRPQSIPGLRPVRAVLIDAAKGGNESGAVNGYGLEKDYNLAIAKEVQRKLQKAGLRAELTRRGDQSIPPQKRAAMARNLGDGTIFVGIRCGGAGQVSTSDTGFEVYTLTPRGAPNSQDFLLTRDNFAAETGHAFDHSNQALAGAIYHALLGRVPMVDRGMKRARFPELRAAVTPAVVVGCGFMSNPRDAQLLNDAQWRERVADSIARGIVEYANLSRGGKRPKILPDYREPVADDVPQPAPPRVGNRDTEPGIRNNDYSPAINSQKLLSLGLDDSPSGRTSGDTPSQIPRIDPVRPEDAVADVGSVWFLRGTASQNPPVLAQYELQSDSLVVRVNGRVERLKQKSTVWKPSRDRGQQVGDECEEVWANDRVMVKISSTLTSMEEGQNAYAGYIDFSAGENAKTITIAVNGHSGC